MISKATVGKVGLASVMLLSLTATARADIVPEAFGAVVGVSSETQYVFNTLSFLVHGFLVMFMAAGFAMLEAGSVRSKNVAVIVLKNISLYSLAGIIFYLVGYRLMYDGVDGGFMGTLGLWSADDEAALAGDFEGGYAAASDWFFQMVFVATTASIVSGALAERIKVWSFLIFVGFLTAVIYPISGSWQWGEGWLYELGFSDFAGSTLVHSVGGWAALVGAIILGARKGRFNADGTANPLPGSSLPLVALGTFILWLGWFGFNGGSQLALGSAADAIDIATIYVNTNLAAAGGVLTAMVLTQIVFGKMDMTIILNGALGGLVAITAEPLTPTPLNAILIGAVGGAIVVFGTILLLKLRVDDVVGAVPVHLFAGIWGTIAVVFTNPETTIVSQLIGIGAIGLFAAIASAIVWSALKFTVGIRSSDEDEAIGLDQAELGQQAYPEFMR